MSKYPRISTTNPAPTEGAIARPKAISRTKYIEAIRPVCALLGLPVEEVMRTGFAVTSERVSLLTTRPVESVDAQPCGTSDEHAIWVWPMDIPVIP